MKQAVTYKGKRIVVDVSYDVRKGVCECCGKKGLTSRHHWLYEFTLKQVREQPVLALKNVSELCFLCHGAANTLRKYYEIHSPVLGNLNKLMEDSLANDRASSSVSKL